MMKQVGANLLFYVSGYSIHLKLTLLLIIYLKVPVIWPDWNNKKSHAQYISSNRENIESQSKYFNIERKSCLKQIFQHIDFKKYIYYLFK